MFLSCLSIAVSHKLKAGPSSKVKFTFEFHHFLLHRYLVINFILFFVVAYLGFCLFVCLFSYGSSFSPQERWFLHSFTYVPHSCGPSFQGSFTITLSLKFASPRVARRRVQVGKLDKSKLPGSGHERKPSGKRGKH